jgi:hypothetical protein
MTVVNHTSRQSRRHLRYLNNCADAGTNNSLSPSGRFAGRQRSSPNAYHAIILHRDRDLVPHLHDICLYRFVLKARYHRVCTAAPRYSLQVRLSYINFCGYVSEENPIATQTPKSARLRLLRFPRSYNPRSQSKTFSPPEVITYFPLSVGWEAWNGSANSHSPLLRHLIICWAARMLM